MKYVIDSPAGETTRPDYFTFDPKFSKKCQQYSNISYQKVNPKYNRGHLVPSSHMSVDQQLRDKANYMTNIVPQAKVLNDGIWKSTGMNSYY